VNDTICILFKAVGVVKRTYETIDSLNHPIDLYKAWNKPEKAEERRARLPQTEAVEE